MKKKYNIEGEPRAELYACAEEWLAALGDRRFMGGEQPNLADLSVFGVIRSVTGTDTFMDLMHSTGIGKWCAPERSRFAGVPIPQSAKVSGKLVKSWPERHEDAVLCVRMIRPQVHQRKPCYDSPFL